MPAFDLTPRQLEIIRLVSLGCSDIEIGRILGIAEATVNSHRMSAMKKMGVGKMALVTRLAIKHRITKMGDKLTPAENRKRGRKRDGWN